MEAIPGILWMNNVVPSSLKWGVTGFTHKDLGEFKFKATYYCQMHIYFLKFMESSNCYI